MKVHRINDVGTMNMCCIIVLLAEICQWFAHQHANGSVTKTHHPH